MELAIDIGSMLLSISGWLYSMYLAHLLGVAQLELKLLKAKKDGFNRNFSSNRRGY